MVVRPNVSFNFIVEIARKLAKRYCRTEFCSKPNFVLIENELDEVGRFHYIGGFISPGGYTLDDVAWFMQKAGLEFTDLKHLLRLCDIRLSMKRRVY